MTDKEKTTYIEQSEDVMIIQKDGHSITINNDGIIINSESGKLRFLNQ